MNPDRYHNLSDDPICRKCGEALEPNGCRCIRDEISESETSSLCLHPSDFHDSQKLSPTT
jgi:hypothetical protein